MDGKITASLLMRLPQMVLSVCYTWRPLTWSSAEIDASPKMRMRRAGAPPYDTVPARA